jgi:hypothetical protein
MRSPVASPPEKPVNGGSTFACRGPLRAVQSYHGPLAPVGWPRERGMLAAAGLTTGMLG